MRKDKANKIIAIGMIVVIVICMVNYPVKVAEKVLDYITPEDNSEVVSSEENDELEEDATQDIVAQESVLEENYIVETSFLYEVIYEKVISLRDKIESIADDISFQHAFVCLNTLVQNAIGKSLFEDMTRTVVLLENGYLATLCYEEKYVTDEEKYAANLIELNIYLEERDIPLLYVQAPYKNSIYDNQYPAGLEDAYNQSATELLDGIDGKVDYIDLRVEMYEEGMNQYDYFFKTDSHWIPEAGFWAFGLIAEELNENYGFHIDESITDIDNYSIEVYEDYYLGSEGRRVGEYIAGVDDISLIIPNFETNLTFTIESEGVYNSGTFAEALLDYSQIEVIDYFNLSPYDVHLYGAHDIFSINNTMIESDEKILVIYDSFARVVMPYLSLGINQIDAIDLRKYKDMSLMEYLEMNSDYEMVIILRNPSTIDEENMTFDEIYEEN